MFRLSNINWGDRDTVKRLVFRDGLKLQLASTELKKDFDIVMLAVKQNENAILFADPSLLDNPDFFKYVLIKRGSLFNYSSKNKILSAATDKVKNNKGLMLALLKEERYATHYLGPKLKTNLDFWKEVLSSTTQAGPMFMESPLFDNKELTEYYLQLFNGKDMIPMMGSVSPKFNGDKDIVLQYFNITPDFALAYMSEKLKNDAGFMYYLWEMDEFKSRVIYDRNLPSRVERELKDRYLIESGEPWRNRDSENNEPEEDKEEDSDVSYDEDNDEDNENYDDYNENYDEDYDEDYGSSYSLEESYYHNKKEYTKETKKTDFSYLFKNNITKLALSQYKGKKPTVIALFKLYSYIVDIRSNDIEEANKFRGKSLPLWKAILKEQIKQFTPDPKVIDTITQSLQVIDAYFKKNKQPLDSPSLQQEKVTLYKASRYKTLIVNLIQYMISFFGHIGIKVKPLQIVSDVSNIKVIGLMADTSGESPAVSQMASQVSVIKDKLTQILLNSLGYSSIEELISKSPKKTYKGITYYSSFNKFVSLDTLRLYASLEELLADVKKEKTIDKNYSKFQVSEGKVILKNKVIKSINYLNPEELQAKVFEYENKIRLYNVKLESYEKKLSNEPKTIQLGDHQVNVVKVLYKNISRLVVIDGPYQGHYVDELVSSTGEVIGSVSKASVGLAETSKTLKNIDRIPISFIEPIEFSNLQKISDYVPATNIDTLLDKKYLRAVSEVIDIEKDSFYNIIGSNILFNIGNETPKIQSDLDITKTRYGATIKNSSSMYDTFNGTNLEIERTLEFKDGEPYSIHNDLFKAATCFPEGLGTRIFTQQVKSASEVGFKKIETLAAKGGEYMGYYIWPKLGYNADVTIYRYAAQEYGLEPLYNYLDSWLASYSKDTHASFREISAPISDIYACKAKDRFIGQELWKKVGSSTEMVFFLSPSSLSMRTLEAYISLKAKKEGMDPKDYLNVDYSKYANYNLECLLMKMSSKWGRNYPELERRLEDSVRNYENGELFRIYQNPKTRPYLLEALEKINNPKLNKDIKLILSQKGYDNVKLASDDQISEDPMVKEIDESIMKQVWDGINKLYVAGTFR